MVPVNIRISRKKARFSPLASHRAALARFRSEHGSLSRSDLVDAAALDDEQFEMFLEDLRSRGRAWERDAVGTTEIFQALDRAVA